MMKILSKPKRKSTSYSDAEQIYTYRVEEQENIWEYYFALYQRIQQKVDLPFQGINQEDISMPRNPVIAKVFRVAKLAENAGYGFDKMIDGWKPYADSKPEFDQGFDFTKSVFSFPRKKAGENAGKPELVEG